MIMHYVNDASMYRKLNSNTDMKIHANLKKLLKKFSKSFTEPEQKFLNEKSFENSNFFVTAMGFKSTTT